MPNTSRYQLPLSEPNIRAENDVRHKNTHNTALNAISEHADSCSFQRPKSTTYQEHHKIVAAEHGMGSAQSYRAGLSISEKFESPDVFNHCIVRLKIAKFQPV